MKPSSLSSAPLFASLAICASTVKQTGFIPQGWQKVETAANPDQQLRVSFALRQNRMQHLNSIVTSGNHLSRDATRAMRAAAPDSLSNVLQWLGNFGLLNSTSLIDEWVHVWTNVSTIEQLLDTRLHPFSFNDGTPVLRSMNYTLPPDIMGDVDFVHPITNFMVPERRSRPVNVLPQPDAKQVQSVTVDSAPACQLEVTPKCIESLYNITQIGSGKSNVTFAIAGFLEENADHGDMEVFVQKYAPNVSSSFNVELVNNGTNPQDTPGIEANLDMQYAKSLGPDGNYVYFAVGGRGVKLDDDDRPIIVNNDNEPYMEFLDYLLDKPDDQLPQVISISYGDDELSVPREYAIKVCDTFGLLTARGVSVIVSSGDGGSAGSGVSSCLTHDSNKREVTMGVFPASCPWVTSVGATVNTQEPPSGATFSGGGFSQIFSRPSWQDDEVDTYIKRLNGHLDGKYNGSKRAFPDVAAVGSHFVITLNGNPMHVDGTSASAPTFAAMIARIIDIRLRLGKKPLGWLNEILYSSKVRAVLQDITMGTSISCTWNGTSPGGWPAAVGWDAMTGLGVPKDYYAFMRALVEV